MAKCNISIGFTEPIDQLIAKAKSAISANGGIFNGDSQQGNYSIPTPLGKMAGTYSVAGNSINFEVLEKPIVISCSRIENELTKYLKPSTAA